MTRIVIFFILVLGVNNSFAQDIAIKDLFTSCNNEKSDTSNAFVSFFKKYDLTYDTAKTSLLSNLECYKLTDYLFYGKIHFHSKGDCSDTPGEISRMQF